MGDESFSRFGVGDMVGDLLLVWMCSESDKRLESGGIITV